MATGITPVSRKPGNHPAKNLRMTEHKYRDIVNSIMEGVYQLDTDGYFTYVNKAVVDRVKISEKKFSTMHYLDLVTPEYRERVQTNFMRVMRGERVPPYELSIKTRQGHTYIAEVHSTPIYDGQRIVGLQGIARDITARKSAEEKLQASEMQFRNLMEALPFGIFTYAGTKIRYLNPACERITGYARKDLDQSEVWEIVHPDDKTRVREYVERKRLREPVSELLAFRIVTKSGEERWLEQDAIAIEWREETVVLVTLKDITERKNAEEELRLSEEKYRMILESASDAIVLSDEHGNLLGANRMAEEILGYTREELLQMHYTQLHPSTELAKTAAAFHDIVASGHGGLQNGAILRKDGAVIPVDITAHAIRYDNRTVFQASFRNIAEHKRIEDTLERLVRERTAELSENNKLLAEEITERKHVEYTLRKKTQELKLHSRKLQELNTALKVLLHQRDEDRTEWEEKVVSNVKHLLVPHMEILKQQKLNPQSRMHLDVLESNLMNIISSFSHKLSSKLVNLTPMEIRIANLVKEGKTNKQIAEFLGSSVSAVNIHRFHIRSKLGLVGKDTNLQTYLSSFS